MSVHPNERKMQAVQKKGTFASERKAHSLPRKAQVAPEYSMICFKLGEEPTSYSQCLSWVSGEQGSGPAHIRELPLVQRLEFQNVSFKYLKKR